MFEKYKWNKRIVIHYHNSSDQHLKTNNTIRRFFDKNINEINDRKLKFLEIYEINSDWALSHIFNKNGFGIYLIGLDGSIKEFSKNTSILRELFLIIDSMPMRQSEIKK